MNRFLLLSVTLIASLAAATGCAHSTRAASVAEMSTSDPSWCPPGEMDLSIGDAREAAPKRGSARKVEMKPNTSQRPTRGAVHAAVY